MFQMSFAGMLRHLSWAGVFVISLFAAAPARVVNVSGRTRYSVALFFDPHPDTEIAVLDACRESGLHV